MNEDKIREKMQKVLEFVLSDLATIRTGRITPSLVEDIEVAVYQGQQKLKLKELATIQTQDLQTLVIIPWDKSIIGDIKKGIMIAGIGVNPVVDGEKIRIVFPPLTTEDRERYIKLLAKKLEAGRIMIRQVRQDAMREVRESFERKEISEDEKFRYEKRIQEITDEYVKEINEAGKKKEDEILNLL